MSFTGDVALRSAEQLHRTLGPRAALYAYRALATSAAAPETRGRAILRGLSCAIDLRDPEAVDALVGLYPSVTSGAFGGEILRVGKRLVASGFLAPATALSTHEVSRFPAARTMYFRARCLERARDPGAREAFAAAEARAVSEETHDIAALARAFRALLLFQEGSVSEALSTAKGLELRELPAELALGLAELGMASPSRFARAAALSDLEFFVSSPRPDVASRALVLAARHADRMGPALTPMEIDRLAALLAKLPDQALSRSMLDRLEARQIALGAAASNQADLVLATIDAAQPSLAPILRRAADAVRGRFEPHAARQGDEGDASQLAISAAVALRDGNMPRAEATLRALSERLALDAPSRRHGAWEAAYLGLLAEDDPVRAASLSALRALVKLGVPAPARGALSFANLVRIAGDDELAAALLRLAAEGRESGAAAARFEHARELGWRLALAGQREKAMALLKEAKAAAPRPAASKTWAAPRRGAAT